MARTLYNRFRDEDSTLLFNNRLRGILEAGVYLGYNVSIGGAGGLWLKFSHDPDPDNTGSVLGALVTHDGVTIQESADQDNVCVGSLVAGTPNVHYVVATYTYNQALPANDVVYSVIEGTAGAPPVPPVLNDDQVLIAVIDIPAGCIGYAGAGVDIKTVGKKSLYGSTSYTSTFFKNFDGVLKPGIYDGIEMSVGSGALLVSLSAGCWITNQNAFIPEAANQVDLFTITAPAVGNYKFVWAVGMHKDEDTDPYPDVDYMLVHSADFGIGTAGALPTNAAIRAVAAVVDAKYTTVDDYINKLGVIRIETRVGPVYHIEYIKGETLLQRESVIVYGAQATSLRRSGKYYGYEGLKQAVADIYAITSILADVSETPYEILLDGTFETDDTKLNLPSNIVLKGYSAPAKILSELATTMVAIRGFKATWDTVNPVVVVAGGATPPPAGYNSKTFAIQALYQLGDNFTLLRHSRGDRVNLYSVGGGVLYEGIFVQTLGNWQFEAFMPVAYNGAGNPTDLEMVVVKRNSGLKDVEINGINTGVGKLELYESEKLYLDNLVVNQLEIEAVRDCQCGFIDNINVFSWVGLCNTAWLGGKNHVRHFKTRDTNNTAALQFGSVSYNDTIDYIEYDNPTNVVIFRPEFEYFQCGRLRVNGSGASQVLLWDNQEYGCIENMSATALVRTGAAANLYVGIVSTHDLTIEGAGENIIIVHAIVSGVIAYTATSPKVRLLSSTQNASQNYGQTLYHSDEDRNLRLVSQAVINWTLSTGVLTWDAPLYFDIPWQTGYTQIAAGSATMGTDGDRLYVDIDREAVGIVAATPHVRNKANATSDRFYPQRVFIALRYSNVIYLYDGTRVEDGLHVVVGSAPPPDGSVSYPKFSTALTGCSADPLAYLNKFLRDHVVLDTDTMENDIVFKNTGLAAMVYTTGTGRIQYSALVDLSHVAVGDCVLLTNMDWTGNAVYTREAILAVDDANDRVYIARGLGALALGAATVWNGAIARGNKVMTNDALTTFTYDADGANPGRIEWNVNMEFTQYQVREGYVFVDCAGAKYQILRVGPWPGKWVDIASGLTGVSASPSVPTTKHHGSIETNNNPYGMVTSDARTLVGCEFIPIDTYGPLDTLTPDDKLVRSFNPNCPVSWWNRRYNDLNRRLTVPYDPRVRVTATPCFRSGVECVSESASSMNMLDLGIKYVEFTGVCTGIAIAVVGGHAPPSGFGIIVDGEGVTGDDVIYGDYNNNYGMEQNRYELITIGRVNRLNQCVHHIAIALSDSAYLRGIFIVNQPLYNVPGAAAPYSTNNHVYDCPGTLVHHGGVRALTADRASLPAMPTYNKGARAVRYVNSLGVRAWVTTSVRSFTDTGVLDHVGDNTHITSCDDTLWRVGDIVMLINTATWDRDLHVVTTKAATVLTIDPVLNFSAPGPVGATMYYYGHVYQPNTDVHAKLSREFEEPAATMSVLEFAAAGSISDSKGTAGINTVHRTTPIGVRLSDLNTAIVSDTASGIQNDLGGAVLLDEVGATMRIWFVGTGLSIERTTTVGTINLAVDALHAGGMHMQLTTAGNDYATDVGGTYICGELPYGQHIVTLVAAGGGTTSSIKSITIWQPKKPVVLGFELLDTNILGATEKEMSIITHNGADMNGTDECQFGTINYEAGSLMHPTTTAAGCATDYAGAWGHQIIARYHGPGVGAAAGDCYDFVFYGDEITLVVGDIVPGGGSITVKFLDTDGVFRIITAITGYATSGVTTVLLVSAVSGQRVRWGLDLGLHVMRLEMGTGAETIEIDAIEVGSPMHMHRTKQPISIDHMVPFNGYLDKRNLTPFRSDVVPPAILSHTQAFISNYATVAPEDQNPFMFYTRGGMAEISVSLDVTSIGGTVISMYIDEPTIVTAQTLAAGGPFSVTLYNMFSLSPGFHYAYVHTSDMVNDDIETVCWRMRELQSQSGMLLSRGQSMPLIGPAHTGESSF